jgi:predicted acetyltransferase
MGQWFGGRSVPMTGVGAVAVAPEARGRGAAFRLMRCALEEMRERGIAISSLYPATQTLFRKAGYEQAGARFAVSVQPYLIGVRDRTASFRSALEADRPAIEALYGGYAPQFSGALERAPYNWDRVYFNRDTPAKGFVVEENGAITGYVFRTQDPHAMTGFDLHVSDMVAVTPGAGRRILTFLADHGSMVRDVRWFGGPADPILALMPEQKYKMDLRFYWMTRIVHLPAALEARGYPEGMRAELHLDVRDDVLPENAKKWVLEVADGVARVREGGKGTLRIDACGLASLYAGFMTPGMLRVAGNLEGDAAAMRTARALFDGHSPWMRDMF